MKTFVLTIIALFGLGFQSTNAIDIKKCIVDYYAKLPQEKIFVHTDRDVYVAGDTLWFRAFLIDGMTRLECSNSRFIHLDIYNPDMKLVERRLVKADSTTNIFANAIGLDKYLKTGTYTIMAYTQYMRNFSTQRFFYKRITIGDRNTEYFTQNTVDNSSTGASSSIASVAKKDHDIVVSQRRGRLCVQYLPFTKDSLFYGNYGLAIYGNGNLAVVDTLKAKTTVFKLSHLYSGAVNIAIVDNRSGRVVSERLAYIKGGDIAHVSIKKKTTNDPLRPVVLDIDLKDNEKTPISGNFSISVVDADAVKRDSSQQTLASYILAGSELEPMNREVVDLFDNLNIRNASKLSSILGDASAMRFNMDSVLAGKDPTIEYGTQTDQRICGKIQGPIFHKLWKPWLTIASGYGNVDPGNAQRARFASNTSFCIIGDYVEGTELMLDGMKSTGSHSGVEVKIEEEKYPSPCVEEAKNTDYSMLNEKFVKHEHMHAIINGIHEMNYLEEVEVKGDPRPGRRKGANDYWGRRCKTMKEFLDYKGFAREYRHYFINGHLVSYKEVLKLDPALVISASELLDITAPVPNVIGRRMTNDERLDRIAELDQWIDRWNIKSTKYNTDLQIHYVKWGGKNLMEWSPLPSSYSEPLAIKNVTPLGYMPKNDADSFNHPIEEGVVDPRTTVYWSPYVELSEDGKAEVTIFPSTLTKRYRVTIQGIASDGSIISKEIEL